MKKLFLLLVLVINNIIFAFNVEREQKYIRSIKNNRSLYMDKSFEEVKEYNDFKDDYLTSEEKKYLRENKKRTYVIGVAENGGVLFLDKETGIIPLYKTMLERHLGIKTTLREGSFGDLLRNLKNDEVDLLLGVTPTKERSEFINFTTPYLPEIASIFAPRGMTIRSLKDLKKKKVLCIKGTIYEEFAKEKSKEYGFEVESVERADYGRIDRDTFIFDAQDTLIELIENRIINVVPYEVYFSQPVSIGISKKNGEVFREIIDKSLTKVFSKELSRYTYLLTKELRKKLFNINLTEQEENLLFSKETLDVLLESDLFPHTYYSSKKKQFLGAQVDLLREISDFMEADLNIKNLPYTDWSTILDEFDKGQADLSIMAATAARKKRYNFGMSLYEEQFFLVGNKKLLFLSGEATDYLNYKTGVLKNDITYEKASKIYIKENLISYNNLPELIKGLEKREVDFIILTKGGLTYLQEYKFKSDLYTVATVGKVSFNYAFNDKVMRDIVNKILDFCIDPEPIYERWSTYPNPLYRRMRIFSYGLSVLSVILLVVSVFLIFNIKRVTCQSSKLFKLLHYDELTGCKNRRHMFKDIKKGNGKEVTGVISFNIGKLKKINNIYGHKKGDIILISCCERVKKILGVDDELYRSLGNEFILIKKVEKKDALVKSAKKILTELNKPYEIEGVTYNIRARMGVDYSENYAKDMNSCIKNSEISLSFAKLKNINDIVINKEDIINKFKDSLKMEDGIKSAIRRGEFSPYFQPKIDLKSRKIIGCEALARWKNEEGEFVSPGDFIPIAENTGLVYDIDMLILQKSISETVLWLNKGYIGRGFKVSVNTSVKTLQNQSFLEELKRIVSVSGLDTEFLEIEVTETIFIEDLQMIKAVLLSIRDLGVSISLDDFSAGHSSTKYLCELPFNIIKFDRSLISGINEKSDSKIEVYKTLVNLGKSLKLKSVAEGIETPEQDEIVSELGIDYGQGYFYNRPLGKKEFEEVIKKKIGESLRKDL